MEAVGPDVGLAQLIRDRDKIFGAAFDRRVANLGLKRLRIEHRSPWQNGFAERWVGTARREIVAHVIVLGEHHLRRILREHIAYNATVPTCRLGATRQCDATSSRDRRVVSSRCRGSPASIIATRESQRERAFRHDSQSSSWVEHVELTGVCRWTTRTPRTRKRLGARRQADLID